MMPSDPFIRSARAEDLETLMGLRTYYPDAWSYAQMLAELKLSYAHLLCVVRHDRILGYADFHAVYEDAHLNGLFIHPQEQGQGMGKALLRCCLASAKDLGCSQMTLEVRQSNSGGIAFYRASGFTQLAVRKRFYDRPVENALVLFYHL